MNNEFYEVAIALRQEIHQEDVYEDYQTDFRLSVLAQIVGSVFANGDKIPHKIQIQYPFYDLPHNCFSLIEGIFKKLSIIYTANGDYFFWTSHRNPDARIGIYCITYLTTK